MFNPSWNALATGMKYHKPMLTNLHIWTAYLVQGIEFCDFVVDMHCNFCATIPSFNIISDEMLFRANFSEPCQCTPKCDRNVYRATVSHAALSKAMLTGIPADTIVTPYVESANRLQDYAVMYKINGSWASSLYRLSSRYFHSRMGIIDISTNTRMFRSELIQRNIDQLLGQCLLNALDMINGTISQFFVWERNTYFLNNNIKLRYENLISHMANDIVRKLGKLEEFASGFNHHLQKIQIAVDTLVTCNKTNWNAVEYDLQALVNLANESISAYYREYRRLANDVKANRQIKSYQIAVNDASEEYVRWVITLVNDYWSFLM